MSRILNSLDRLRAEASSRPVAAASGRTVEDDFMDAICAAPEDDTPRLIYADWLEERGDPRAEFIRLQCRRAPSKGDYPQAGTLGTQEREFLDRYGNQWSADFRADAISWKFRRGFIDEIVIPAEKFLLHGAVLIRKAPLRQVGFTQCRRDHLEEMLTSPLLSSITALDFSFNQLGDEEMRLLPDLPNSRTLQQLGLEGCRIGDEGARILSATARLSGLKVLDLGADPKVRWTNHIGDDGAEAIASSRFLSNLSILDLRGNPIRHRGRYALTARFGNRVRLSSETQHDTY